MSKASGVKWVAMGSSSRLPEATLNLIQECARQLRITGELGDLLEYINATGQLPLSNFDESERAIRDAALFSGRWSSTLSRLVRPHQHPFVIGWLDITNGSGYTREHALKVLDEAAPNAYLMVLLLRRLNDWVAQVRGAAHEAVERVADKSSASLIANALWAIFPHQYSWKRLDPKGRTILDGLAGRSDIAAGLAQKIGTATSGRASFVLRQAARTPCLDPYLPHLAHNAAQPSVRARAYRMLFEAEAKWQGDWGWKWIDKSLGQRARVPVIEHRPIRVEADFSSLLKSAAMDRSVFVRRVAGDAAVSNREILSADDMSLVRLLSKDKYGSVSERAEFVLRNRQN